MDMKNPIPADGQLRNSVYLDAGEEATPWSIVTKPCTCFGGCCVWAVNGEPIDEPCFGMVGLALLTDVEGEGEGANKPDDFLK